MLNTMRTRHLLTVAAAALLVLVPASSFADDTIATDLVPVAPGSLSLRLHLGWEASTHEREGVRLLPADPAARRQLIESRLSVDFGFGGSWTMHASIPMLLVDYNQKGLDESDGIRSDALGVGDPVMMLARRFEFGRALVMLGAGASMPIGGVGESNHVEGMTGALVTSSSLDGLLSARLAYRVSEGLAFRTLAHGRVPLTDDGLQSGVQYGAAVGFMARIWGPVAAGLDVRYLYRGHDRFQGADLEDTGGRWLYLQPGLRLDAPGWVNAEVRALVPISEYRFGRQMAHDLGFMLTVGKTF